MSAATSASQQVQNNEPSRVRPAIVDVAEGAQNSVVQIRAVASDGTAAYGTGFVVTEGGIVVTSADIVASVGVFEVSRFGDTSPAELLFKGAEPGSLAILQTKLRGRKLRIASHEPNVKDQVSAIGWESTPEPHLSSIVGSIVDIVGNKIYYSRSDEGRPGFSGGPVINEQGEVIGVNIGALFGANVAWAVNLRTQLPILRKFGIVSEEVETTDTSVISSVVGCDAVDERSRSIDFHLAPDQEIVDANAQIAEQVHVAAAKVSIERVAGSVVTVHSWAQGQPRNKLLGLHIAACDTGHVSILVHIRVSKSPVKP